MNWARLLFWRLVAVAVKRAQIENALDEAARPRVLVRAPALGFGVCHARAGCELDAVMRGAFGQLCEACWKDVQALARRLVRRSLVSCSHTADSSRHLLP